MQEWKKQQDELIHNKPGTKKIPEKKRIRFLPGTSQHHRQAILSGSSPLSLPLFFPAV